MFCSFGFDKRISFGCKFVCTWTNWISSLFWFNLNYFCFSVFFFSSYLFLPGPYKCQVHALNTCITFLIKRHCLYASRWSLHCMKWQSKKNCFVLPKVVYLVLAKQKYKKILQVQQLFARSELDKIVAIIVNTSHLSAYCNTAYIVRFLSSDIKHWNMKPDFKWISIQHTALSSHVKLIPFLSLRSVRPLNAKRILLRKLNVDLIHLDGGVGKNIQIIC